jgi:hypothetical protein
VRRYNVQLAEAEESREDAVLKAGQKIARQPPGSVAEWSEREQWRAQQQRTSVAGAW